MAKAENAREAIKELREWHRENFRFVDSTLPELRQTLGILRESNSEAITQLDNADSHLSQGMSALEKFFELTTE